MTLRLTDDAKSALALFQANPAMRLNFGPLSRIHPRMRSALDQLVDNDLLTEDIQTGAQRGGLSFYANPNQRDSIRLQPRVSMALLKKTQLPATVD